MRIADLCDLVREPVHPRDAVHERYVGLEHVDGGALQVRRWSSASEVQSSKSRFLAGDVLYGKLRPNLSKAALVEFDGVCSTELLVLRPRPGVPAALLAGVLQTRTFREFAISTITGAHHPRTSWAALRGFEPVLPSASDYMHTGAALRALADATRAEQEVVTLARELKETAMRSLFAGTLRHVSLGTLGRVGNGSTPKRTQAEYWAGGTLPWLTSGKVHERVISAAEEFVTPLAAGECHLPRVPAGSLLVAITGQGKTLGNVAMTTFDTFVSQHLAYLTIERDDVDANFVRHYLSSRYDELRALGQGGGSTKGAITCAALKTVPVPVPPLDEQREVARTLDAIDRKTALHERKRATLQELFDTLLHGLMSGRLRVAPVAGPAA